VEEPLFLNHLAYVVKDCLSGDQTGIWLRLRPLRLEHMQAWGSTLLEENDDCVLYKPKSHHDIYEPVWWCSVGARFTFLY
jgi:hypothetical protein